MSPGALRAAPLAVTAGPPAASPDGADGTRRPLGVDHAPPWHRQEEAARSGPAPLSRARTSGSDAGDAGAEEHTRSWANRQLRMRGDLGALRSMRSLRSSATTGFWRMSEALARLTRRGTCAETSAKPAPPYLKRAQVGSTLAAHRLPNQGAGSRGLLAKAAGSAQCVSPK
ncbi:hypothetical protein NN561_011998 [Cricetulus griseus]